MRRRRVILAGALLLGALIIYCVWPRGPREPGYQGKRLTRWLDEQLAEPNAAGNDPARQIVRSIGTNAIPFLLTEFTRPISKSHAAFNRWAAKHPWINLGFEDPQPRLRRAAYGLGLLGPDAVPALPAMAQYLGDEQRGWWAQSVMADAGEKALPYILQGLASTNHEAAERAAELLGGVASHCESAALPLIQLLQHKERRVRATATRYLANACLRPDLTVPALAEALTNSDWPVSSAAFEMLSKMGPEAQPAVPELLKLLTNSDSRIVFHARDALSKIDPSALGPRAP
jgi:hypothetical protein